MGFRLESFEANYRLNTFNTFFTTDNVELSDNLQLYSRGAFVDKLGFRLFKKING